MTLIGQEEIDVIQTLDFNAKQPLQSYPTGNDIMPGSPTAAVPSSAGTGNSATLVSPTQTNGPQTSDFSRGQSTEVSIETHPQTASPTISTNLETHDDFQKKQAAAPSDATQHHTQIPFNQESNVSADSGLSTSSSSEAATVITITTTPAPVLPSVVDVSESSNMPVDISNGLPSIPILVANTDMKAITETKATLDINTNAVSRSTSYSDMEIDDELPLQPSQSNTASGSGSLNPDITATSENISIPSPRLNGDKLIPSESAPASLPDGVTDDNTKLEPASTTSQNTSTQTSIVLQPKDNLALRVGVEHALRSLVGETAIDSKLVLRLARELKWAKNQIRESKDNANGGEVVQPPVDVSALIAERTLANNEINQLRKQLSDIEASYKNAVVANQKFDLELSKLKKQFLDEMTLILKRNRELEFQLGQSQIYRDSLSKKCEFPQNELNKLNNIHNAADPGSLVRANRTQSYSPMNSPAATGTSTSTPISRQHALLRRPSIIPSQSVSEGVNAIPSQSPRQGMPPLSPAGTGLITSGSTPAHTRNGSLIVIPPRPQKPDVVSTSPLHPPAQGIFEHQLQQMRAVEQQRQQQRRHSNPAAPSMGQLSPAHQQQQTVVPYQMQPSNLQDPAQSYLRAAHYMAYYNEQALRQQQAHSLPGMVPNQRSVVPPGHQPSQSGEVQMQMQLRRDLPQSPSSGSDAPRTQFTPPTMLSQQLPSQSQPQRIHSQTTPSFNQNQPHVQNGRSSQPQQNQIHYVAVPPPPMTIASSPNSLSTQNPRHANPQISQPQPKETSLKPFNVITAPRNLAEPPHAPYAPYPYPPQSYVMSPSQVSSVQPYPLQVTETQQFVPQDTQATTCMTDTNPPVIDLTTDETEETDIKEPPKKRPRIEEAQAQVAVTTLTEPGPTLDESQVVGDGVEPTVVDVGQPVESIIGQADTSTTMAIEPKNEPQPQSLIDGLEISSEEFTVILAAVFQDSENDTSTTCFFCADRKEDDDVDWSEIHLQNPAVEDMVNHLKEIHPLAWERICRGEY